MGIIDVEDLRKHFPVQKGTFSGKEWLKAVDGVSFSLEEGGVFALVGESGSGKSTVARLILRLLSPTSGRILFKGRNIPDLKGNSLQDFRKSVQIIFQDPFASLNPRMTVRDTVAEPLKIHKRQYLAERTFRNLRSDLAVNPVWLQLDERIAGLMLVYAIALTLLALMGVASRRAGLSTEYYRHMTPVAILRCFAHLRVACVTARGQPDQIIIELTDDQAEVIRELKLPYPDTLMT